MKLSCFRVIGHFWKEALSTHRLPTNTHRKCFCVSPARVPVMRPGVGETRLVPGITSSELRADLGDLLYPKLVLSQPFSCISGYKRTKQGKGESNDGRGKPAYFLCFNKHVCSCLSRWRPSSPQTGVEMLLGPSWPLTQTHKHMD